jgi:hypothetical protein
VTIALPLLLGAAGMAQGAVDPMNRSNTGVCSDDWKDLSTSEKIVLSQDMDGTQLADCKKVNDGTNNYNIPEEDEDGVADREVDFGDRFDSGGSSGNGGGNGGGPGGGSVDDPGGGDDPGDTGDPGGGDDPGGGAGTE